MTETNFHLVLDLDSTLIHTIDEDDEKIFIKKNKIYSNSKNYELRKNIYSFEVVNVLDKNIQGSGNLLKTYGFFRPNVIKFLKFCSKYFYRVHIWSAGQKKYVQAIVNELFKKNGLKIPKNILTYNDCTIDREKDNILKPLKKLFKIDNSGCNETNTFAIDDRKDTFSKNPKNGILIPAYEPNVSDKNQILNDICLLQLIKWFKSEKVKNCKDVRKLNKSNIFEIELNNDDYFEEDDENDIL